MLRGMMDEYERGEVWRSVLRGASGALLKIAAACGGLAVFAASLLQLARAW